MALLFWGQSFENKKMIGGLEDLGKMRGEIALQKIAMIQNSKKDLAEIRQVWIWSSPNQQGFVTDQLIIGYLGMEKVAWVNQNKVLVKKEKWREDNEEVWTGLLDC